MYFYLGLRSRIFTFAAGEVFVVDLISVTPLLWLDLLLDLNITRPESSIMIRFIRLFLHCRLLPFFFD